MIEIKYDNTPEESKKGFMRFYFKYMIKRMILFSVVYLIAFILGLDMLIKNPTGFFGPIIMALTLGLTISLWVKPTVVWRKVNDTLSQLDEETYIAKFYDEKIVIETMFVRKETPKSLESPEISEKIEKSPDEIEENSEISTDEDETPLPEPTEITLVDNTLFVDEDSTAFRLFVNRSLVYVFPKRCLSDEQIKDLDAYFTDKNL